jgi:uncharacterized membrane protein YqiK
MDTLGAGLGVLLAVILIVLLGVVFVITRLFRKVEQGRALIISKVKKVDVTFTGAVVLPIIHKAEFMDISVKTIDIERTGHEGLICQDNIRADIRITFFVRVNKTVEDVIRVAQAIGTERASDQTTLQELFNAKFSEALKTVGKHMDFVDLYTQRDEFRDQIIRVIGTDLNGYSLEDAAIDFLEQTPMSQLDTQNILDAQGIRKITELTAQEHVRTNDFERGREKEITRQNVEARETILELERRQADAEATQQREVDTLRAREEAETARVQAEERLKAESANIRTDEQVGVQTARRGVFVPGVHVFFLGPDTCRQGVDEAGRRLACTWQLTATDGDGPYVPVLAATAIARKYLAGDVLPRGAYPCVGVLSLADFERETQGLSISTETVEH